jgi:Glycosyltransferase like family
MKLGVVAAVNKHDVLEENLLRSPMIAAGAVPVQTEEGHVSCSAAYNHGIDAIDADVIVLAHQDVYLPRGWDQRLTTCISTLQAEGTDWGVLGVYGVRASSEHAGQVWSTGLQRELDSRVETPQEIVSLDELVLVIKRDDRLRFDEALPGFHLYGTDIVQTALDRGMSTFVFPGPVIHNSSPVRRLPSIYWQAHRYLSEKWRQRLPIPTCTVALPTRVKDRMRFFARHVRNSTLTRPEPVPRLEDPAAKARELGYE